MSLIGDLEFKTIINNKLAIIKMPNAYLDIENFIKGRYREAIFTVNTASDEEKNIYTIEIIDNEEEEH